MGGVHEVGPPVSRPIGEVGTRAKASGQGHVKTGSSRGVGGIWKMLGKKETGDREKKRARWI
jgi:hypothetical protein